MDYTAEFAFPVAPIVSTRLLHAILNTVDERPVTLDHICERSQRDWLGLNNFGQDSLRRLNAWMALHGRRLGNVEPPKPATNLQQIDRLLRPGQRIREHKLSPDYDMVILNLKHRLLTTSEIHRANKPPMNWAEAEMLLHVVEAFKRTQPVWYELFVAKGTVR